MSCAPEKAGVTGHRSGPGGNPLDDSQCSHVARRHAEEGPFLASVHRTIVLGTPHAGRRYRRRVCCLGTRWPLILSSGNNSLLYSSTNTPLFGIISSSSQRVRAGRAGGRSETHRITRRTEFAPQTTPLTPDQLAKSYQLLQAASRAGKKLLSFFNCGSDQRFCSSLF